MPRAKINDGWETRTKELVHPDVFSFMWEADRRTKANLSLDEWDRTCYKMDLILEYTKKLAANMLKGTLKYERDDWSLETHLQEEEDEWIDQANYRILIKDAMRREGLL